MPLDLGYPSEMTDIKPETCRAARGLLNWTRERLAAEAGVSFGTVNSYELHRRTPVPRNLAAIKQALEAAGVEFLPSDNGGPGVRLKQPLGRAGDDEDG
jgi:transcriptional regulator with XRE-family HTH domain